MHRHKWSGGIFHFSLGSSSLFFLAKISEVKDFWAQNSLFWQLWRLKRRASKAYFSKDAGKTLRWRELIEDVTHLKLQVHYEPKILQRKLVICVHFTAVKVGRFLQDLWCVVQSASGGEHARVLGESYIFCPTSLSLCETNLKFPEEEKLQHWSLFLTIKKKMRRWWNDEKKHHPKCRSRSAEVPDFTMKWRLTLL